MCVQVQCAYHGWTYDSQGRCTSMPSAPFASGVSIDAMPVVEADGLVWVWLGSGTPKPIPTFAKPPDGFTVCPHVCAQAAHLLYCLISCMLCKILTLPRLDTIWLSAG